MTAPPSTEGVRSHALGLVRLGLVAGAIALAVCAWRWPGGTYQPGAPRANLAVFFKQAHGLTVQPADIALVSPAGPWGAFTSYPVFFLARERDAPRDAYFSDVTFSPTGVPLSASTPVNLTRTSAADEWQVAAAGTRAAFLATEEGQVVVTIVDLAGESRAATSTLDRQQRWQNAVTNLQETGRLRGYDKRVLELASARAQELRWTEPGMLAIGPDHLYDASRGELVRGAGQVRMQQKSRRQFVHWAVDTARAISFIGPKGIAWMEDTFFELVDKARHASGQGGIAGDELMFDADRDPGEPKVAGWPPPPFAPILKKPEKGEGEWTLMHDPFIGRNPDRRRPSRRPSCAPTRIAPTPRSSSSRGTRSRCRSTWWRARATRARRPARSARAWSRATTPPSRGWWAASTAAGRQSTASSG